ncbi:hypothetical protein [Burkholderia thailandensis]|uniref:hypothetical protein n=1 Tax=Burkholderia thailandensis TaxID=57975 RepID=UPI0002DB5450|nr:hypothetical protein [Burkholderia thailandensis]AIP61895.1 hypothetical protein DR62_2502 [Burkholderia thailandensis]AOI52254.1 hypothetical protein WI24_10890 [Burkholderia thailandensis]
MESLNENAAAQGGQELGVSAAGAEQSSQTTGPTEAAVTGASQHAGADVVNVADASAEHPLDIIAEIEHLLRIVGNVAVHEFRRITERLADLKNHPAIKPGD